MLNDIDRERIAAAVAEGEARTSGEIVCIVARRVSAYPEVPLAWAAGLALILPPIAVAFGVRPLAVSGLLGQWVVGHAAAIDDTVAAAIAAYAAIQALVFVLAWLLVSIPTVRRLLTPGPIKAHRVRQAAYAQYVATGLAASDELTGVVIFASLDDRRVEVVADPLIHQKCGEACWKAAAAAVVAGMRAGAPADGFVKAVGLCADVLATHFPDDAGPNRLPNRPLEI